MQRTFLSLCMYLECKFKDLRILLFLQLNIHTHDLRPNTVEAFSEFSKLLNLTDEKETKYICNYISDAMKVDSLLV